jgi:hypothetical protein
MFIRSPTDIDMVNAGSFFVLVGCIATIPTQTAGRQATAAVPRTETVSWHFLRENSWYMLVKWIMV